MKNAINVISLICALTLCHSLALAEIYEWTDSNGSVHFSDNPINVPKGKRPIVRQDEKGNVLLSTGRPSTAIAPSNTSEIDPKVMNEMIQQQNQFLKDHNQVRMESVIKEAGAFIDYLRVCHRAFPNTSDRVQGFLPDPPDYSPVISYPFNLKVTLYPDKNTDDYTVVILNKRSSEAPWRIVEAWKETSGGKRTIGVSVPTNSSQDKGNKALPSLMIKGARFHCP